MLVVRQQTAEREPPHVQVSKMENRACVDVEQACPQEDQNFSTQECS
jgi:hypothetical protein